MASHRVPKADPSQIRYWIELLADKIGPRPCSIPETLDKVARILADRFSELGYKVEFKPFRYKNATYCNVIAAPGHLNGTGISREKALVIVGAHYDTVSGSPGADDNASGIAGVMEVARILANSPPEGLRLVTFTLEEPPAFRTRNMGSYHYAQKLKRSSANVMGMICLEMIGYFSDRPNSQRFPLFFMNRIYPDTGNFIALVGNKRSTSWTNRIKDGFSRGTDLPAESLNAPWLVIGIDFSDHWSFYKMGYPAVMVTDTAFYRNPHYHRPSDLPDTIDFERAAKVVDGISRAILDVSTWQT